MSWDNFRKHFPIVDHWTFFDHAAVCPIPDTAVQALTEYADRIAKNGLADVEYWVSRIHQVRVAAAKLVNAPSVEDICFIPNTTMGIGLIAEGFPWQEGDSVVLAAEEYPSNQYPWLNLAYRGVEVRRVPSQGNNISIDDIRSAIGPKTRLLSASFVQFSTGFRSDLAQLSQLCEEKNLFFFLDAIQGLGAFPLDVQQYKIDACAADGHKWLLGPEGAGIAYIRREWVERLHAIGIGAHSVQKPFDYSNIDLQLKPHAGRWEGGAVNIPGIVALGASIQLISDYGPANVAARIIELTDHLCQQASHAGLEVYSNRSDIHKSGIVSVYKPGADPLAIMRHCREHGVCVNVRGGRVRVSPHAYNTLQEIDRFIEITRGMSR
jgi:cysteine desulfurase / selenocysteine lyase